MLLILITSIGVTLVQIYRNFGPRRILGELFRKSCRYQASATTYILSQKFCLWLKLRIRFNLFSLLGQSYPYGSKLPQSPAQNPAFVLKSIKEKIKTSRRGIDKVLMHSVLNKVLKRIFYKKYLQQDKKNRNMENLKCFFITILVIPRMRIVYPLYAVHELNWI